MSTALYHQPGVPAPQAFVIKATRVTAGGTVVDLVDTSGRQVLTSVPVADVPMPGGATLVPDPDPGVKVTTPAVPPSTQELIGANLAAQARIQELEALLTTSRAETDAAIAAPGTTDPAAKPARAK